MRLVIICCLICVLSASNAQDYHVTFEVDMQGHSPEKVSLKGSVGPLGWTKEHKMIDPDGDGIYTTTVDFKTSKTRLQYLFVKDGSPELVGSDKRSLRFNRKEPKAAVSHQFDQFDFLTAQELTEARFSAEQINEDIDVLRETLEFIHPNLYKYTDSASMEHQWEVLRNDMLKEPTLVNAYKAVSKFAVYVKCSHTFTNPWNQSKKVDRAIFYQPNKIPFTFGRIEERLFIERNASESEALIRGKEILSINDHKTANILSSLVDYITSDGDNYEKRLERLTLTGASKFELFDIFFPLEYGNMETFEVELRDVISGDTSTAVVSAMSKTSRSTILTERYPDFEITFEDGWEFKFLDEETGYLRIDNFSVFNNDFDWKKFIDNSFSAIRKKNPANLIIDIRANEGGDDDVAAYILERLITASLTIEIPAPVTNYKQIPDGMRKNISTWDNRPYNWGDKVSQRTNGQYELKKLYSGRTRSYKPKAKGYKGKTYLMIGAQNSSATHLMATYFKKYRLATLVGQETGGNQRGLNGGQIFFHKLPNTRIELDIPIFSINVLPDTPSTPNGGIKPDISIEKNAEDFVNNVDTELTELLKVIRSN